eukprot:c26421_g1_i1 orf=325-1902(+)
MACKITQNLMGKIALVVILVLAIPLICAACPDWNTNLDGLISCLGRNGIRNYTTNRSASYSQLLDFSLQNLRFTEAGVPKPSALIFPQTKADVQNAVICSLKNKWELRVRSGGHSYEGLSSTADAPFVIIDLMNMHSVVIDMQSKTAWVEAGATVGEIYYGISQHTSEYGFPAGTCPTLGAGGHFSGAGYGMLSRKYGVAADNIIDAQLVNAEGNLLDKQLMGDDLFWALQGGGGGSWGIVVAWKIKLVAVPVVITTFNLERVGKQVVAELVYKWQTAAPSAPGELFMAVYIAGTNQSGTPDTRATFYGQYLGNLNETLQLINSIFPELGLVETDCKEGSWIEAVAQIAYAKSVIALTDRYHEGKNYFKAKSDYVKNSISAQALEGAFSYLEENMDGYVIFEPYGGVMSQIPSDAIAFPHRAGNLYIIQYQAVWQQETGDDSYYINWLRRFYSYMRPYVSQNPRAAFVNYLDLDLGSAVNGTSTVAEARSWGSKYFLQNFDQLVKVKSRVDPYNVFRNPQSIPPI